MKALTCFFLTLMIVVSIHANDNLNPNQPVSTARLVFIHHSVGGDWLTHGGLRQALNDNNYYVTDTNYDWGPDSIGSNTDIGHWYDWFLGPNQDTYTEALYANDHISWGVGPNSISDPGGENTVVMFKSCYPNGWVSSGNPDDPPLPEGVHNPIWGREGCEHYTVENIKGLYRDLLDYFATRQDKLFILIATPPSLEGVGGDYVDAEAAARHRGICSWLVHDWLTDYPYENVFAFDYYNVLTSNGGDRLTNDLDAETGNHHRFRDNNVQHVIGLDNDFLVYDQEGDNHPTAAGHQKATGEFTPLLNIAYNRWQNTPVINVSVSPESIDFGEVDAGETSIPETITVTNEEDENITLGAVTLTGANSSDFAIQSDNCSGQTFTPSESRTITVVFSPTSLGQKNANLVHQDNPPFTVTLMGSGAPGDSGTVIFQHGVSPIPGYEGTTDAMIIAPPDWNENANLGGGERLSTYFATMENFRTIIRFELQGLPPGANILSATLSLRHYEGADNPHEVKVYRLTREWVEGTGSDFYSTGAPDGVTWIEAAPGVEWDTLGGDFDTTTDFGNGANGVVSRHTVEPLTSEETERWEDWDITPLARGWVNGTYPNYGVILRPAESEWISHDYRSRNYEANPSFRPRLTVIYGEPSATFSPVTNFNALVEEKQIRLTWENPSDPDWIGTRILRKTDGYPLNETDGTVVYDGTGETYTDTGLMNGNTYYYGAFACYDGGNYSVPRNAEATLTVPPVSNLQALCSEENAALSWENPTDYTYWQGTRVLKRGTGYTDNPDDATCTNIYEGTSSSYTDVDVLPDTTYYYSVFTFDDDGIFSQPAHVQATITAPGQPTVLLVDFGASEAENTFGLAGWNTAFTGSNTDYTDAGPGGTTMISGSNQYDDFQGITGTPREFRYGHQIVVIWHNNSSGSITFRPLVSFEDADNPDETPGEPQWYGMSEVTIPPGETGQSTYDIYDGSTGSDVGISAGTYSLVNVCIRSTSLQNIAVCDRIELNDSVDTTPPSQPLSLQASAASDTAINLSWGVATDNVGVMGYRIYQNGNLVNTTSTNSFTDYNLEFETEYAYTVTAVDEKRNESEPSLPATATTLAFQGSDSLINPLTDMRYLGAFKLPAGGDIPYTWNYGGFGMTYYPGGDPGNIDGDTDFPGSIYGFGHMWDQYVSEMSIPTPVISPTKDVNALNTATTLQDFHDIKPYNAGPQLPTVGIEYLPKQGSQTTDKLYVIFGDDYAWEKIPTHGACELDLSNPQTVGKWYIGSSAPYGEPSHFAYNRFIFAIPQDWSDANTPGKLLISGGYREGGLAGLGPALFAISPWDDAPDDTLPPPNTELTYTRLLQYGEDHTSIHSINGYVNGDDWAGGAFLTAEDKSAVILTGSRALGEYWYGWFDGTPVYYNVPLTQGPGDKGWWMTSTKTQFIFYAPDELAAVANGTMESYEPQPYAVLNVDEYLFNEEPSVNRMTIASASFDRQRGILYVVERDAYGEWGGIPLVHVWQVGPTSTPSALYGDVNGDGNVTAFDAIFVLQHVVGLTTLSAEQQEAADVTDDGAITAYDAVLILQHSVGLITQFPVEIQTAAPALSAESERKALMKAIAQLETANLNREQRQVLEQLKSLAQKLSAPKQTSLLQNFPNPFNPETWIPFELAKDVPVTISIYNTKGQLVRSLNLGITKAGIYTTKDKAAYWDGCNQTGEPVASGVYFYTLKAKDFRTTRRMVIVK